MIRYIKYSLISCLIFGSCKLPQPATTPVVKNLPDSFPSVTDSSSIATISWRQFFTDQHLVALIDTTLQHNPDLFIALQRIDIAKAQLAMRRGAIFPTVNGVISAGADRYGDYTLNGVGNYDTNLSPNIDDKQKIPTSPTMDYFIGFRSNWEIDIWGKLKDQRKAAVAELLATQRGRQYAITALVGEVASRYYHLLALDNELAILKRNIALQESALEVVKIQKEAGRATELAVHQFAAQLLNTRAIQYSTRQQIIAEQNELNVLAGRYPQDINRDSAFLKQPLPASIQTGLPSLLLTRRPDIQQAEFGLAAAKLNISAARKAFFPSLTLTPYAGLNAFKSALLFDGASAAYGILGGLTTPIFGQRKLQAEYAVANAQHMEAVYNYQKVLLNSYSEVVTNLNDIENTRNSFQLKEQEVKELSEAVATAKDLYLTGYASYLEVITAQKGVLDAELQLTNGRLELFQSVVNLYRSLGGGWN